MVWKKGIPQKYHMDSRIKDVYAHPVGRDIINKLLLQLNLKRGLVDNLVAGSLKLSTLRKVLGGKISPGFWEAVLALLNADIGDGSPTDTDIGNSSLADTDIGDGSPTGADIGGADAAEAGVFAEKQEEPDGQKLHSSERIWWKEAVFYQIYPRSFMDSDGDGIGDIGGIISRLDYLKELGIDALWLCPVYDSPQDDNGYDIRDYQAIDKTYGSMTDFEQLLKEVHNRDMKLIMDLVINHTSDEHEWFQKALADPASGYRDYYHFRKGTDGNPPNNWTSFFSGSAWKKVDDENWALKLFSSKQMDLNWENPALREEIYHMVRWWLEKGVDGFRLDVINYISKAPGLPEGDEFIGALMEYRGIEHYFHGPRLHEYLRELRAQAFAPYRAFTVGETPGIGLETGKLLTAPARRELDMIFSFDHLENPGKTRFDEYVYDPVYLKEYYTEWMEEYGNVSWMSLFYDNHDNPRMLSKLDPGGAYRDVLAKLLGVLQLTLKGTPFLFQGQELGAVNVDFQDMSEIRDVESLNFYQELSGSLPEEKLFHKILGGTRDHARVPMKWDSTETCGFTSGTPWIRGFPDRYNVKEEIQDPESVLCFYKKMIALRRENEDLIYGDFKVLKSAREIFAYIRGGKFRIILNLSEENRKLPADLYSGVLVIGNYGEEAEGFLRPYEARVYHI